MILTQPGNNKGFNRSRLSLIYIFIYLLIGGILVPCVIDNPAIYFSKTVILSDVLGYYTYLPAIFIYHDIRHLSFIPGIMHQYYNDEIYWFAPLKTANYVVLKYSMGMAFLYSPFFFVAHKLAPVLGYPADGFSLPYRVSLYIGSLLYALAGLIFLRKLLLKYFKPQTVLFTLVIITLATNYFYYVFYEGCMTHGPLFTLFAVFFYYTDKWIETGKAKLLLLLGFITGLAVMIRPTEFIILIIPLLWKVDSWQSFRERINMLWKSFPSILMATGIAFLVCLPQLIYWKIITGHYIEYTYTSERFYFLKPHIIDGLFSVQKGWLFYTPVMALAIVGFFYIRRQKGKLMAIFIYFVINVYIVLSWWCWHYSGSFGLRAFVQSYAFLSFPLAMFIELRKQQLVNWILAVVILFTIALNHVQSYQYHVGIIPYDTTMTIRYYRDIFFRFHKTK